MSWLSSTISYLLTYPMTVPSIAHAQKSSLSLFIHSLNQKSRAIKILLKTAVPLDILPITKQQFVGCTLLPLNSIRYETFLMRLVIFCL